MASQKTPPKGAANCRRWNIWRLDVLYTWANQEEVVEKQKKEVDLKDVIFFFLLFRSWKNMEIKEVHWEKNETISRKKRLTFLLSGQWAYRVTRL